LGHRRWLGLYGTDKAHRHEMAHLVCKGQTREGGPPRNEGHHTSCAVQRWGIEVFRQDDDADGHNRHNEQGRLGGSIRQHEIVDLDEGLTLTHWWFSRVAGGGAPPDLWWHVAERAASTTYS
jgi:hypothetical protein